MKFVFVLLMSLASFSIYQTHTALREDIIGEWVYQFSWIDTHKEKLNTDIHCPVYKIVFEKSNDGKKLSKLPQTVIKMRENNIFRNISSQTYNKNGHYIDTYYPTADILKNNIVFVANYGMKYKSEYFIDYLKNDTLVIYDEKNYTINNRSYRLVKHVYVRQSL
ncbi:hypothetical protein QNI16_05520 [Cytophagaceae bacterium YF14B1]|uniref:Uncharacterized protein n=1 Tax=Xanthocytophaga flava TaxID=3048013 RepID=A0AAE3QN21_9BACT|nr:hypothetical protein [Xanthocytophaga flavus]MDJ1479936.1 hypothetical protein [Xanthocytophaga flavus]